MTTENIIKKVKELDEQIEKAIVEISRLKWEKTQLIISMVNENPDNNTSDSKDLNYLNI